MSQWTKEKVHQLSDFVNHRDYIVMVRNCDSTVAKVTPVDTVPNPQEYDTPGWFGFGPPGYGDEIDDDHDLSDYQPEDFLVFRALKPWDGYVAKTIEEDE